MHWLFLIGWNWSFFPDSKWLISPGANKGMVTIEEVDKKLYINFYSDKDDIRRNLKLEYAHNQATNIHKIHQEELFGYFIEYMEVKKIATFEEISNDFSESLINKKYTDDKDVANILTRVIIIGAFKKYRIDMNLPKKTGYMMLELMNDKILKDNTQIQYLSEEESQNAERLQREERQARMQSLATAPKNEKKPYIDAIKDLLSDDIQRSISEIQRDSIKLTELRNQQLASILSGMVKGGYLERIYDGKVAFFSLPGYKERTAGREKELRIEKAKLNNHKVRENIDNLEEEKKHLEEIIKMNSKMLFGEGAKAKKEAKKRLEEIEAKITRLRLKLLPEY